MKMGRFLNGVLVGVGIGLLIAPVTGEEMRRLVSERYKELRDALPEKEQIQRVATSLSQTASSVKDAAHQAATRVQRMGSARGDLEQQSAQKKAKQTGQDVVRATRHTARALKQRGQTATKPRATQEKEIVFVDHMKLDERK